MKYVCLGYGSETNWDAMTEEEREIAIEKCFSYDDELWKNGHWVDGGQALQGVRSAKTLRWKRGKVVVTDGPFAETKEQVGGFGELEARNMDHAIELLSKHPSLDLGIATEIRPIDEQTYKRPSSGAQSCSEPVVGHIANAGTERFACLGYIQNQERDSTLKGDTHVMIDKCIAFEEQRRKDGQFLCGIALQGASTAKTLRLKGKKLTITDGPYAETKEWLGGVLVLQLKDMAHAIAVLSTHPGLLDGAAIEIRPIDERMNARWESRCERVQTK